MSCGTNFAYILKESSYFRPTEYKVLQSQASSCFVKCMKMLYNGKVQLYYLTSNLKPLRSLLHSLDSDSFITIVSNLFTDIIDVKHNGFLACQNIDISFDRIYVEPNTYKVQLVYLPTNDRIYSDYATFEAELRTGLIKLISAYSNFSSSKTLQLSADLSNGMLSLEDLSSRIKSGVSPSPRPTPNPTPDPVPSLAKRIVRLSAVNAHQELTVNKEHYVIGKNAAKADGVITFNNMISRTHCCIDISGKFVTVTDLGSANGTYLNHVRLQPNRPSSLNNGDILRLADSDFRVSIV